MDGPIALTGAATIANTGSFFPSRARVHMFRRTSRVLSLRTLKKRNKLVVCASKEGDPPELDQWDQMELKFGHMIGEDPKLTLAKILGRKANPEATFLEIEKNFYKKKGKLVEIKEVPFDESKESSSLEGLNLVRPVPKKGFTLKADEKGMEAKKPSQRVRKPVANSTKGSVPNVILRKPAGFNEDNLSEKPSMLRMKPNLSLKMGNGQPKDNFSSMTILRKPEPVSVNKVTGRKLEPNVNVDAKVVDGNNLKMRREEANDEVAASMLLKRPVPMSANTKIDEKFEQLADSEAEAEVLEDIQHNVFEGFSEFTGTANAKDNPEEIKDGLLSSETKQDSDSNPLEHSDMESIQEVTALSGRSDTNSVDFGDKLTAEAALLGKPKRLDQSVKATQKPTGEEMVLMNSEGYGSSLEFSNFVATSLTGGSEDADWTNAEGLVKTSDRGEVEVMSASTRGFVVSFRSLVGFLPYRNLGAKWKFLAFESWLRQKGLDPSSYRQNLGVSGSYDAAYRNSLLNSSLDPEIDQKIGEEISADMKWEDLLRIYDQEKLKFLSSFVGQKIKVNVLLADRRFRKLIFSVRRKEREELVEKKRSLMATLQVGDVVKCCVKKITYFGIFVEVEGVPALIHQTEVSWDATLDPSSYYKIGQILEAKVIQLDLALERIFLSLKEVMPDPLMEALESVVGDRNPLDGRLQAAQAEAEWAEMETLVKELQQIKGIQSVSKGRFFLSPGLAPMFQVYMASMFENQYKLLARSGNKVQEVIVQASFGKEEMKSAILTCTNRVE